MYGHAAHRAAAPPVRHAGDCPGREPSAQSRRCEQRLFAKTSTKAIVAKAWRNVSPQYQAERLNEDPRAYAKRLDLSEQHEPPMRWLLDCDSTEFESVIQELRRERLARERTK